MFFTVLFCAMFLLACLVVATMYNNLVRIRNEVKNAWSQIDVQLKRRHDLIPNLVETVKGYTGHEQKTLEAVVKARQQAVQISGDVVDQARLENALSQTLRSLFAVTENYPQLQANQNFMALQEEITGTENKISFARQYYNDAVMAFNTQIESFPINLLAPTFHFTAAPFFEMETPEDRKVPVIQF